MLLLEFLTAAEFSRAGPVARSEAAPRGVLPAFFDVLIIAVTPVPESFTLKCPPGVPSLILVAPTAGPGRTGVKVT